MKYTYAIEQAIQAATLLHRDQVRKGRAECPYVSHLFSVAAIISGYTDNEETIIAGLLHDTIEDTPYTYEELETDFGERVRDLVYTVTEEKEIHGKELSWIERKETYIKKLKKGPEEALVVAAADKIHNLRSILEEYHEDHGRFLRSFGGSLEEKMYVYQSISNVLNRNLQNEIIHEFNDVFEEYKHFIHQIEEGHHGTA